MPARNREKDSFISRMSMTSDAAQCDSRHGPVMNMRKRSPEDGEKTSYH